MDSAVTRINFDYPDEEYARLVAFLPKGVRGEVMRYMCRTLTRDFEAGRFAEVVQALLDDKATVVRRDK
jgi:hypothetical protein